MAGSRIRPPISEKDHLLGRPDAPVTLMEYGDFECPHCARAHSVVQQLRAVLGDQLRYVYRHFPLSQIHPHATLAAEASEAAAAQGRFWEMHDLLYRDPQSLDLDSLIRKAEWLQLDVLRFATELNERVHSGGVAADFRSGLRSGVVGTPAFFLNGERFEGPWDFERLLGAMQVLIRRRFAGEAA